MPTCNKCKKHSNCLTIDPCDHCGATDWDYSTVLKSENSYGEPVKDYAQNPCVPPMPKGSGASAGTAILIALLIVIGYVVYYYSFTSDRNLLANKYSVRVDHVTVQPKPHGCAYNDAPLGNKHCHFDKHVYVYDKNQQLIVKDAVPQTCYLSCGPADRVVELFEKVGEE